MPPTKAVTGKIDAEHWLTTAKRAPIDGGGVLTLLYVVIHYTEGFNADSSVSGWKTKGDGVLAHVVVDRDGTIFSVPPF